MRILVTCFGPFGERAENASMAAAALLAQLLRDIDGVEVDVVELAVSWAEVAQYVAGLDLTRYHLVIGLGEGREQVWVERGANAGAAGVDVRGEAAPARTPREQLPLDLRWKDEWVHDQVVQELFHLLGYAWPIIDHESEDVYLCNYLRRLEMEALIRQGGAAKIGFVHLPPMYFMVGGGLERDAVTRFYAFLVKRIMELNGWIPDRSRF